MGVLDRVGGYLEAVDDANEAKARIPSAFALGEELGVRFYCDLLVAEHEGALSERVGISRYPRSQEERRHLINGLAAPQAVAFLAENLMGGGMLNHEVEDALAVFGVAFVKTLSDLLL